MALSFHLELLAGRFAVARLPPSTVVPDWALGDALSSVTVTPDEVSVICGEGRVPDRVRAERGLRCLRVRGPLAFSEIGVLHALAEPLARAAIPIFALSTFDTDYLLLSANHLEEAVQVLERSGHAVDR